MTVTAAPFAGRVALGRTGLAVSRLGLGSAYGVSERGCLEAFDAGVNYFFWGSTRTVSMGLALRQLARRPSPPVIVLECYVRHPWLVARSVERGLRTLGVDAVDVLLLGWHDRPPAARTVEAALRLRDAGRVRFLGLSSHARATIARLAGEGLFDVYHVRYNAAHRGAEREIFPVLPASGGPGIVSFTNTRWGDLLAARHMPSGERPLTATECYRFALSDPHVHVAVSGPKDDRELADALAVLRAGPLDEGELARARRIGDHVHGLRTLSSLLT